MLVMPLLFIPNQITWSKSTWTVMKGNLLFLCLLQHGGNIIIYVSKAPAEHQHLPWPGEGEGETVTQTCIWVTDLTANIRVVLLSACSSLRAALVLTALLAPCLHETVLMRDWGTCPCLPNFKIWTTFSKSWNKHIIISLTEKNNVPNKSF